MDASGEEPSEGGRRESLLGGLDRMVESGRVTEREAQRLRAAAGPDEFAGAVVGIRVRHAEAILAAAVEDGSVNREEADGVLARLRNGEHAAALRAQVRRLRRRPRSDSKTPGMTCAEDNPQQDTPA